MLDKILFAVRRVRLEPGRLFGSWKLSIVLMVLAGLYYLLLAIWAGSSPPHVIGRIATLLPFWLLYLLLLVNTGVCLYRRLPVLKQDLATGRRRASLGTYLFHGSFFLVATGFLLTLSGRTETRFQVAEGEIYRSDPPGLQFVVRRLTPEFWQDQMLFTRLEADLGWADGSRSITRINRPIMVGPASFLRLSGFGYAPRYELLDRNGAILDSAWVKMNLFPPGLRDRFQAGELPHRFYLSIVPDPEGRTLNLEDPVIDLELYRGHLSLGGASLRTGQSFEFEGLAVRIAEIGYWGEFTLVRDPGILPLFAGFALGLLGLVLRVTGKGRVDR
jgi:hypothetical protein